MSVIIFNCPSSKKYLFKAIGFILIFILVISSDSYSQIAKGSTKFLGNVIGTYIPSDFLKYWDQVTPENAGKLGNAEPVEGVFKWGALDSIYNFAIDNKIPFKFHNLVWGKQQPEWISKLDSAQQVLEVVKWIKLCGERYPKAAFVDVVNEPIRTKRDMDYPPYYKAIGGKGKTGWDWVIWSFEQARKYFPHSKLLLNEYGMLNGYRPVDTLIKIVNLLKERNLIDGVGIQGHFLEKTDSSIIYKNLNRIAKLGLPIYISEYDVDIANDAKQLEKYKEQFPIFWNCPEVKGITLWGYIQKIIWRTNAYLVRSDGLERPALKWLKNYIMKN